MEQRNRVVEGMQEWLQREDNVSRVFSPATLRTRYFQELKLDYLLDLQRQVRPGASKDERITLRILKGERKMLEKALYPNTLVRLVRSFFHAIRYSVEKRNAVDIGEKTNWMLQVVQKDSKKADRVSPVRPPRNVNYGIVVKKKTSQGQGLKI